MTEQRPPLDWAAVVAANDHGCLFAHLEVSVPRTRWGEKNQFGCTLLHFASWGDTACVKVLLQQRLDVNARDQLDWTPAHVAAYGGQAHILELLCAAGADLRAASITHHTPLDEALGVMTTSAECVRVLVANGAQLSLAHDRCKVHIQPWMIALEKGRFNCRAVILTFLGLKRRRCRVLHALDRCIGCKIAVAVWTTRADVKWQPQPA